MGKMKIAEDLNVLKRIFKTLEEMQEKANAHNIDTFIFAGIGSEGMIKSNMSLLKLIELFTKTIAGMIKQSNLDASEYHDAELLLIHFFNLALESEAE